MRAPLVLLVLALLGVAAWFAFGGGDAPAPTPTPPAVTPEQPTGPVAPPVQGDGRIGAPTPPPDAPTPPPPTTTTTNPPADAPPPNLVLRVRHMISRDDVAAFRWQFRNSRGTSRGQGEAGRAACTLEASAVGQLLVEAEGCAPLLRENVIVPTPPDPAATLDLFLGPATPGEGIVLFVRDLALRPVTNVRVDAFPLTADAPPTDWTLGQALWARRAAAADGRYPLPGLQPGSYGIRVVGLDDKGLPLPLLPWRHTFTLTGSNGFVEDVALEPGARLVLDLVDANGQPYDPSRHGVATFDLRLVGGPQQKRKWLVRSELSEASAIDVMPGIGQVELADALLAGPYQLDILVGGSARVMRHQMFLRAGATTTERITVP